MYRMATIALLLAATVSQTPHAHAITDASGLNPNARPHVRYLWLPAEDLEQTRKILSFHVNQLSREPEIVLPVPRGRLLRVDMRDYGWPRDVWEKLADSEPYYTVRIESKKDWPGGIWRDGKHYPAGAFWVKDRTPALAPWLDAGEASKLAGMLQSQAPLIDARWFVWQTSCQADRDPGYYDFIGVKEKADLERLVGYDAKLQQASKRVEMLEAVADSTVTLQPRRIGAFPAIGGTFWQTFDSRKALDEHNPLRILNGGLKFDAMEVFGPLPNGLMVWGLFDKDGKRQDSAPDFIASDSTSPSTDRRVHVCLSCVRCHGMNSGINPVDGWARNLFRGELKLQSPDYDKLRELRQKYFRDLKGPIDDARRLYSRAVAECTDGMKVEDVALAFGNLVADYEAPRTAAMVAADLGMKEAEFVAALKTYILRTGTLDTVASVLLRPGGKISRIDQTHEVWPLIMAATKGRP